MDDSPAPERQHHVQIGPQGKRSAERLAATISFLRVALGGGPVTVTELEQEARAARLLGDRQAISQAKPFRRAKQELGIQPTRIGFGRGGEWTWSIAPTSPAENTKASASLDHRPAVTYAETQSDTQYSSAEHAVDIRCQGARPARHDADIDPEAWRRAVARLDRRHPLPDVSLTRWEQFIRDCASFLDGTEPWARRAAGLRWRAVDLFGCNRSQPLGHLGVAGLMWVMDGGRLARLHADWAAIELRDGQHRTFHRRRVDSLRVVLPWEVR